MSRPEQLPPSKRVSTKNAVISVSEILKIMDEQHAQIIIFQKRIDELSTKE